MAIRWKISESYITWPAVPRVWKILIGRTIDSKINRKILIHSLINKTRTPYIKTITPINIKNSSFVYLQKSLMTNYYHLLYRIFSKPEQYCLNSVAKTSLFLSIPFTTTMGKMDQVVTPSLFTLLSSTRFRVMTHEFDNFIFVLLRHFLHWY